MKTVLLHGLGQTAQDWAKVTEQTLNSNIDCPEIFSSEDNLTYTKIYDRLEQRYLNTTEPFRICGLSLGALLALDFTIRHKDKVDSLILIAAQYKVPGLLIDFQNIIFRCMPNKAFDTMGISKRNMLALTRSMRSLDFTSELGKIVCPITIVCGEKDKANLNASKKLKEFLPHAKLCIVPEAGHEVNKTNPQAIADILNE